MYSDDSSLFNICVTKVATNEQILTSSLTESWCGSYTDYKELRKLIAVHEFIKKYLKNKSVIVTEYELHEAYENAGKRGVLNIVTAKTIKKESTCNSETKTR